MFWMKSRTLTSFCQSVPLNPCHALFMFLPLSLLVFIEIKNRRIHYCPDGRLSISHTSCGQFHFRQSYKHSHITSLKVEVSTNLPLYFSKLKFLIMIGDNCLIIKGKTCKFSPLHIFFIHPHSTYLHIIISLIVISQGIAAGTT